MFLLMNLFFPLWMQVADLKTMPLTLPNGTVIQVEWAETQKQREAGLMGRTRLAPDRGMLFIFQSPDRYDFWMKNTLIPLDIIWLDSGKHIIYIAERVPPCKTRDCPSYGPTKKSLYTLELDSGMAGKYGLKVGMILEF